MACKKNGGGCTDSEERVSVVRAVTRRLKHPTVTQGKVKYPLTLTGREVPADVDVGNHVPLVGIKDLDKNVRVPNFNGLLSEEKWTTVQRKRNEKKKAVAVCSWLASHWWTAIVSHNMHYRSLIVVGFPPWHD